MVADRRRVLATAALLLASTLAPTIRAQAPTSTVQVDEAGKDRMLALLREGTQFATDGDWDSALKKFRAAHAAHPDARLLLNIGTALRMVGKNAAAAAAYERYLASDEADPSRAADLRRHLKEIDELVGRVNAVVSEPGAEIRLDGERLPLSGSELSFRVDPGDHTIVAQKEGRHPAIVNFHIEPRDRFGIRLDLVGLDNPKPPPVEHDPNEGDALRAAGIAIASFGVVGLGLGTAFGVLAKNKNDEAAAHCGAAICDGSGEALGDNALTFAHASTISFVVGGLALAGGLTMYLIAPEAIPVDERTELAVVVGVGQLSLWGRF